MVLTRRQKRRLVKLRDLVKKVAEGKKGGRRKRMCHLLVHHRDRPALSSHPRYHRTTQPAPRKKEKNGGHEMLWSVSPHDLPLWLLHDLLRKQDPLEMP